MLWPRHAVDIYQSIFSPLSPPQISGVRSFPMRPKTRSKILDTIYKHCICRARRNCGSKVLFLSSKIRNQMNLSPAHMIPPSNKSQLNTSISELLYRTPQTTILRFSWFLECWWAQILDGVCPHPCPESQRPCYPPQTHIAFMYYIYTAIKRSKSVF